MLYISNKLDTNKQLIYLTKKNKNYFLLCKQLSYINREQKKSFFKNRDKFFKVRVSSFYYSL
jgi:hypothetical protein